MQAASWKQIKKERGIWGFELGLTMLSFPGLET